jgi:tight adherence protein C
MLEFLLDFMENRQLLVMMFAGIAAAATVLTLAMPLLSVDQLDKRMAAVASERERIRQRERDRMGRGEKASLRTSPRQYMQTVVEKFKLSDYVGQEAVRAKLIEAGYRGHGPSCSCSFVSSRRSRCSFCRWSTCSW